MTTRDHRRFDRLVFDFRGNGGGNDGFVFDWIAKAKRGTWFSGADLELMGALTPCQSWNPLIQRQVLEGIIDSESARAERERMKSSWPPGPHHPTWVYHPGQICDSAQEPYAGKLYVIVDRYSASSGESGPWALKAALGATLIGERTAGLMEYGNVQSYLLPNTGIRWTLATKRNLYAQPLESVGLPVDLYLADPTMPAEEVLALLDAAPP